ncbi:putative lipoprotein [Pseudomonas sp. M47T1]|uniref:hypothetical protein n=1 Tax=unclassified Pseudomonas TaxID=196821 RepID=UPI0002607657|nr:hypothetical protein [Pseudomonas sp. M47T1]EIK94187.1 putative lipoprotein [Pseudomonas sp. M47T1]
MKRVALALAIAATAACAHQPAATPAPTAPVAKAQPTLKVPAPVDKANQLMFDMVKRTPLSNSVFRNGDQLSFMVIRAKDDTLRQDIMMQIQASCVEPSAQLMYFDGGKRSYVKSQDGLYMPGVRMRKDVAEALLKNPDFIEACNSTPTPDWRVVHTAANGQQTLVDRASIKPQGDSLRFWTAWDEPVTTFDLPYYAPMAQKREYVAVDCKQQTFKVLSGFDVDERNRVTDGIVHFVPEAQQMARDTDNRATYKALCGSPQAVDKLPPFSPRLKAPLAGPFPGVMALPLAAIHTLGLPAPRKPLTYLAETGTANGPNGPVPLNVDTFIQHDTATGQLAVRSSSDSYDSSEISFRGLFSLASKTTFHGLDTVFESSAVIDAQFQGDWRTLPVGGSVGVALDTSAVSGNAGAVLNHATVQCTIKSQVSASQVNSHLSGQAKLMRCTVNSDKRQSVDTLYYLEDYGYFYQSGTDKNDHYYSERQLRTAR